MTNHYSIRRYKIDDGEFYDEKFVVRTSLLGSVGEDYLDIASVNLKKAILNQSKIVFVNSNGKMVELIYEVVDNKVFIKNDHSDY